LKTLVSAVAHLSPDSGNVGTTTRMATGEIVEYARRQAATVGREAPQPPGKKNLWVPKLPSAEGSCLGILKGEGGAGAIAIFPDGRRAITGDGNGCITGWDLESGVALWRVTDAHEKHSIYDVMLSPNAKRLASASGGGLVKLWIPETGECARNFQGHHGWVNRISWCPDSNLFATGADDGTVRSWKCKSGNCDILFDGPWPCDCTGVAWSPSRPLIAIGFYSRQCLRVLNLEDLARSQELNHQAGTWDVQWSPDGNLLASAGEDHFIHIWRPSEGWPTRTFGGHSDIVYSIAWSPDCRLLASASRDRTVRIWDVETGKQRGYFSVDKGEAFRVAWSPDGAFVASSHPEGFHFWDTRSCSTAGLFAIGSTLERHNLTARLASLPGTFGILARVGIYPPLSLLASIMGLLATCNSELEVPEVIGRHPAIRDLQQLGWPAPARTGLIALLLRDLPAEVRWPYPPNVSQRELHRALEASLSGNEIPAIAPTPPWSAITSAADAVDDRVLTLLTLLGPEAVAADPGLPLRLLPQVSSLPPLAADDRHLLSQLLTGSGSGQSQGTGSGGDLAGIERRGQFLHLLPTQLALPTPIQLTRYFRGELLYRARSGAAPPRLRPTVLLLDVSPPTFGAVERTTRLAAFCVASTLLTARLPVVALLLGGLERIQPIEKRSDLIALYTERSLESVEVGRGFRLALALREQLRADAAEPAILLLSHPFFAADEETLPAVPGLRALFVHYPGRRSAPALAFVCERAVEVDAPTSDLAGRLAWLLG
jgi:WD40 repeat protein